MSKISLTPFLYILYWFLKVYLPGLTIKCWNIWYIFSSTRIVERRRVLPHQLSNILMELEDLSVTQEEKDKSLDLAGSFKHACLPAKEVKRVETSLGIEQALEPRSQEFLACLPPAGGQGYEDHISEGLQSMDIDSIKTQEHQGMQEFIENWFQSQNVELNIYHIFQHLIVNPRR
jgi:hypothetical protein